MRGFVNILIAEITNRIPRDGASQKNSAKVLGYCVPAACDGEERL